MTDTANPAAAPADPAASPQDDPNNTVEWAKCGLTCFNRSRLDVLMQMPLPGVIIFVHGVNSDGEWYAQAEEGLCAGLNKRLARQREQMKFATPEGGQLAPAKYIAELTPAGFINPDMNAKTFIQTDDTFTPVIRFRWGYKASAKELQDYGKNIYLNEENYWGGGPFANGCTALPDLWGAGLDANLGGPLKAQSLNSTNDRQVYDCPPRPYYVLAALRLATLVASLRKKQADLPITIVCHSQGNMIGMAAAFLGEKLYKDPGVADTYVLCNAPYSLLAENGSENYLQSRMQDPDKRTGRQTRAARADTLANFFKIIGDRKSKQQSAAAIDKYMANAAHGFSALKDRAEHGYNGSTYGRVTLYCNPHDQVISTKAVQGVGWLGMSRADIAACKGEGVFAQRVFSSAFPVGSKDPLHKEYKYWTDREGYRSNDDPQKFWYPESPKAEYSFDKALDANTGVLGKIGAGFAAIPGVTIKHLGIRINALPPDGWVIPLEARPLPEVFVPTAVIFDRSTKFFDTSTDAPGANRNQDAKYAADDPYGGAKPGDEDAPRGTKESEAALRYDHHAFLRMRAKREGKYESGAKVLEEDNPKLASADYTAWRNNTIKEHLANNIYAPATDHSTIVTNPMHAEKALAYDVAIGSCTIRADDLRKLRQAADWRLLEGLDEGDPSKIFFEYFRDGKFNGLTVDEWANSKSNGSMPEKIVNQREGNPVPPQQPYWEASP